MVTHQIFLQNFDICKFESRCFRFNAATAAILLAMTK